jgi:hypothetical protein
MLYATEYAYNNSEYSVTKVSSFYAIYGINLELTWDVADDISKGEAPAVKKRAEELMEIHNKL